MAWSGCIVKIDDEARFAPRRCAQAVSQGLSTRCQDQRGGIFWQEGGRVLQGGIVAGGASGVSFGTESEEKSVSHCKKNVEVIIFLAKTP
jgi:hypothetical protein